MKHIIFSALAAVGLLGFGNSVEAATFVVDPSESSVTLTPTGGGGALCGVTSCEISAELAPGFPDPSSFDLSEGETQELDFIQFSFDGITGLTPVTYDITATLSFSSPDVDVTSAGSGAALFAELNGVITVEAGLFTLDWTEVPLILTEGPVTFEVDFEEGVLFAFEIGSEATVTTAASVTLISQVPLPASGLVLLTGIVLLPVLRRRKAA